MGELHHECKGGDGGEGAEVAIQYWDGLGPRGSLST